MLLRVVGLIVILVLLSAHTAAAQDINFLEISLVRYEVQGGDTLHDIVVSAGKDSATTCELVTPIGTYSCINVGGSFQPQQDFIDDHSGMSFAGLEAVISTFWTLTWDAGPAQTVVNITFGTVLENDFLPFPTITAPVNKAPIEIPPDPNPPTIEWTNEPSPSPCNSQFIFLIDQAGTVYSFDEISCVDTSWTPSLPLADGIWNYIIARATDYRDVPVGLDIVEGTWPLENSEWLALVSIDRSLDPATGISELPVRSSVRLENYPNPFNPITTIHYTIPTLGPVTLRVYDIEGRLVATVVDGESKAPGAYTVTWDGRDTSGAEVASGIYFLRIESRDQVGTRKIALLK